MKRDLSNALRRTLIAGSALVGAMFAGAAMADDSTGALRNHTISYVLTDRHWAVYVTPDKKECPQGMNDGPREQFKILFPEDGTKRKLVDTQLAREGEIWHPRVTPEPYAFKEPQGTVSMGLNLDGKVGPNDFTSPEGEKGIDNQLYRVLGCVAHFRGQIGRAHV